MVADRSSRRAKQNRVNRRPPGPAEGHPPRPSPFLAPAGCPRDSAVQIWPIHDPRRPDMDKSASRLQGVQIGGAEWRSGISVLATRCIMATPVPHLPRARQPGLGGDAPSSAAPDRRCDPIVWESASNSATTGLRRPPLTRANVFPSLLTEEREVARSLPRALPVRNLPSHLCWLQLSQIPVAEPVNLLFCSWLIPCRGRWPIREPVWKRPPLARGYQLQTQVLLRYVPCLNLAHIRERDVVNLELRFLSWEQLLLEKG